MENFGTDKATGPARPKYDANGARPMEAGETPGAWTPAMYESLLTVKVKVREVYGVRRVYVQSFHRGPLKKLTGRETLTESDISALEALGYTVEIEAEAVTL